MSCNLTPHNPQPPLRPSPIPPTLFVDTYKNIQHVEVCWWDQGLDVVDVCVCVSDLILKGSVSLTLSPHKCAAVAVHLHGERAKLWNSGQWLSPPRPTALDTHCTAPLKGGWVIVMEWNGQWSSETASKWAFMTGNKSKGPKENNRFSCLRLKVMTHHIT